MKYLLLPVILVALILVFVIIPILAKQYKEKREIKSAGNRGEEIARSLIEGILHNDDILLNNVSLNVDGSRTEIDNIIINKNGIFIIEVKYYNGSLYGDIDDFEWTKTKVSPGGNVFTKRVKNPVKQMKRQIYILSHYLKAKNVRIWIDGYAYFVNNNSPIYDDCIIENMSELDRIIHQKQDKTYDEKTIQKARKLLS